MRELVFVALALLAGGTATAFVAPVAALNTLSRLEDVVATTDLAYAEGPRHGVDVYAPAGGGTGRPVVVFFYGGGWEEGERANYRFVGAALASRGIVVVIPDYRVYPQVRFPDFLKDGAKAVSWAHAHAASFGGDAARLVIAGHSAGAHIAAMLAFDPQWLDAEGIDARRDIARMVGLAGPYDFLPLHSATLKAIFGPQDQLARTQPINFVSGGEAPAFLAAGAADVTVDPANTARMVARIRARGGRVTTHLYERLDHRTVLGAFARPLRFMSSVLDDVSGFVHEVTTREGAA